MGLRRYVLLGLVYLVVVIVYAFLNSSNDFRIVFFGNVYVLPIAIWVALPAFILFIASILHIFIYSIRNYFEKKSFEKDEVTLKALLKDLILEKNSTKVFKTKEFSEIGSILTNFNLVPKDSSTSTSDSEINNLLNSVYKINNGQYVTPKELKLYNDTPYHDKNVLNEVNHDVNFALEVIKKASAYSFNIVKVALLKVLAEKNIASVIKFIEQLTFDREMVLILLEKDSQKITDYSFSQDTIANFCKKAELSSKDFVDIARFYKNRMGPDELIRLFENLSSEIDEAMEGYLYILFEFEMIDTAREILTNSAKNEYLPFKAVLDLKDFGKHYSIDTICK